LAFGSLPSACTLREWLNPPLAAQAQPNPFATSPSPSGQDLISCRMVPNRKSLSVRSAVRAPRPLRAPGGDKGYRPALLSPPAASFLRCALDRFLLTKPNTSCILRCQRRYAPMVFGFIPECRSESSRISVRLRRNPHLSSFSANPQVSGWSATWKLRSRLD
jgi:hypothetical protein